MFLGKYSSFPSLTFLPLTSSKSLYSYNLSIVDFVGAIEVDFDIKEGAKLYVWGTQNREIKGAYSTLKALKKDIKAWYADLQKHIAADPTGTR